MRRDFREGFWAMMGGRAAPVTFAALLGGTCALLAVGATSLGVALALWYVASLGRSLP